MRRIKNLTGVRAIAALWVVMYHIQTESGSHHLGTIVGSGWMGVDVFYVLSGFVLSLVYATSLPATFNWTWYRTFLSRRIAKIYPLHIITFCLIAIPILLARHFHYQFIGAFDNSLKSAICNILLIHSLGLTRQLSWNTPSWSVSAEWVAYSIVFAPTVFLLRRVRTMYVAVLVFVLWAGLLCLVRFVLKTSFGQLTTDGALRIVPEFLGGYLLYRLIGDSEPRRGDLFTAVGLILLLTVSCFPKELIWLLLPTVMILLTGLYGGGTLSDGVFGNRIMGWLGDASYSIYLVQVPVIIVVHQIMRHAHIPVSLPADLFSTVLIAVVGIFTFRFVEEPLRLKSIAFFKSWRPRQT